VGANSGDTITVGSLTNSTASGLGSVNVSTNTTTNTGIAASAITTLTAIATGTLSISITGGKSYDVGAIAAAATGDERLGQVVAAINNKTPDTGVTAYLTKATDGTYSVGVYSSATNTSGVGAVVSLTGFTTATTGVAATTTAAGTLAGVDSANLSVSTQGGAWAAMKTLDAAIDQVNSARATLGAIQSRFENATSNISSMVENVSAARGRIMDTDFAKETANLSRTQILQQAGTAMVAQANQLPQGVLALLR
jgi:flagellin